MPGTPAAAAAADSGVTCCTPLPQVETAREQNNKLAEELEDCMMELRAWQEENRRVRKMLALAQGMKEAQQGGWRGGWRVACGAWRAQGVEEAP